MAAKAGTENQPLNKIEWVDPKTLRANSYNPNRVAPPEMKLLKTSILEDGWTQPIVARIDGEIVDGFHRFTLGSTDPDVMALTGGLVPVVRLLDPDMAHQMMSTIRHNRARGTHRIVNMSKIMAALKEEGLSDEEIQRRLSMEEEEVERLLDHSGMTNRGRAEGFGNGWVPK
jgi:ParB-like chromosome segregation protein Spo0J